MQYAKNKTVLVHARVYQNTLVIHIEDACLNVWLIQTAHKMKPAGEINVKILAQDYVVKTQNVRQLTMCPCVHVPMDILGIRSDIVHSYHRNVIKLFFTNYLLNEYKIGYYFLMIIIFKFRNSD